MDYGEDVEYVAIHLQMGDLLLALCSIYDGPREQLEGSRLLSLAIPSIVKVVSAINIHHLLPQPVSQTNLASLCAGVV